MEPFISEDWFYEFGSHSDSKQRKLQRGCASRHYKNKADVLRRPLQPKQPNVPSFRQLTKVGGNVGAALLHPPITNYTELDEARG
jgi:hypothetical protein